MKKKLKPKPDKVMEIMYELDSGYHNQRRLERPGKEGEMRKIRWFFWRLNHEWLRWHIKSQWTFLYFDGASTHAKCNGL